MDGLHERRRETSYQKNSSDSELPPYTAQAYMERTYVRVLQTYGLLRHERLKQKYFSALRNCCKSMPKCVSGIRFLFLVISIFDWVFWVCYQVRLMAKPPEQHRTTTHWHTAPPAREASGREGEFRGAKKSQMNIDYVVQKK